MDGTIGLQGNGPKSGSPRVADRVLASADLVALDTVHAATIGVDPGRVRDVAFYRAEGCASCDHSGYRGRLAVLEVLVIDDAIRDMVVRRASAFEIKEYAAKKGMVSLREDALRKLCQGLTTLDEVIRVTVEDE